MKRTVPMWIPASLLAGILVSAAWAAQSGSPSSGQHVRRGVVIDFEARGLGESGELVAGEFAEVRFHLTEEATGAPVSGIVPGVWLDMGEVLQGKEGAQQKSCKDKIALYLKGVVGIRPMLDLNSYYIVVMNREPSLSIVDPLVSMAGVTSTLGQVSLPGTGIDWALGEVDKQLYVSMPETGQVAVVETNSFKVVKSIEAGVRPTRVRIQPDGRYLWVGNDADPDEESGVTVIDTQTLEPVATIETGGGHHEIAFTPDSRTAFVSNRQSGTVSVIDVANLREVKDIDTGPLPLSLAYSPLSESLYVADGKAGTLTVISGAGDNRILKQVGLAPGLGPVGLTPDGRYAVNVNPATDRVYVIDTTTNEPVHEIEVAGKPYQVTFSRAFAYVRALENPRVTMINLTSLGEDDEPIVQGFDAGSGMPMSAGDLPLAEGAAYTTSEAAVFVVNPADNTTYFYMEGMNAAAGNYRVYGASARAVTIVDRSLEEVSPGEFVSTVKLPAPGRYDVAFMLETPEILHCFSANAGAGAEPLVDPGTVAVEYLQESRRVAAGAALPLRFRLLDKATQQPLRGIGGVSVMFFRTPGLDRTVVQAEEEGDGVYVASLPIGSPGGYYVHVGIPSRNIGFDNLPYFTLAAVKGEVSP